MSQQRTTRRSTFKDLTGRRFGSLEVIEIAPERSNTGLIRWLCRCVCGTIKPIVGAELTRGSSKSCGCRAGGGRPVKDLKGTVVGRLTVESFIGVEGDHAVWMCRCECGGTKRLPVGRITKGKTVQCDDCVTLNRDEARAAKQELKSQERVARAAKKRVAHNFVDMTGQRFGRLVVIEQAPSGKDTNALWRCLCDCGNETTVGRPSLRSGGTKSCGCYLRDRRRAKRAKFKCRLKPGIAAQRTLLKQYKTAAKNRGHDWDLSDDQFFKTVQSDCFYCGLPPDRKKKISRNGHFYWNGIDRVDNELGYTLENTVTCCAVCNHAKHVMSRDTFISWIGRAFHHLSNAGHAELLRERFRLIR